jgi:hypothetical protein
MLRDSEDLLVPAVADTVAALALKPEDAAAVKLAQRYAAAIDDSAYEGTRAHASAMRWIAPQLLAVLESLGATPVARTRLAKGDDGDGKPNRLQQLRDARRA